jgi:transposase
VNDTQLYYHLLGLCAPWKVSHVDLSVEEESVRVYVDAPLGTPWQCPACKKVCALYDWREERSWRHLDSCGFTTWLVARLPRVECSEHGVKSVEAPWSLPNSRFTLSFECFAIRLLQATKVQSRAASLLRLSPTQVHDLMKRAVNRGLARRDHTTRMPVLSMDEKSMRRGHSYVIVLGDIEGRRILDVARERTLKSAQHLLRKALSQEQRKGVRAVTMDFWKAFMSAAADVLPHADIVHDRFHIVQYLNNAVDQTRRSEHRRLCGEGKTLLAKTKYMWLKHPDNLTPKQQATLDALENEELMTSKVWSFKETFRDFFSSSTVGRGARFLRHWIKLARSLDNSHLTEVADMFERHREGLLAYVKHRITNGLAEAFNSQIQEIKTVARGFGKFENFRIAILFFLGKLELYPHKTP